MTMGTSLTIFAPLKHAGHQMTMTNLAETTRKVYRPRIRRFFDRIAKTVCQIGARRGRGWKHRTIKFRQSPGDWE